VGSVCSAAKNNELLFSSGAPGKGDPTRRKRAVVGKSLTPLRSCRPGTAQHALILKIWPPQHRSSSQCQHLSKAGADAPCSRSPQATEEVLEVPSFGLAV